jgi:hypothetical protein
MYDYREYNPDIRLGLDNVSTNENEAALRKTRNYKQLKIFGG